MRDAPHRAALLLVALAASLLAAAPASAQYSFVQRFGGDGGMTEPGTFGNVQGVAVSGTHVYGGDQAYSQIEKFTTGGEFVENTSLPHQVWDLDAGPDGNVYVLSGAHVYVYSPELDPVTNWALPDPQSGEIARGIHVDAGGRVFVADTINDRVLRYSATGGLLNAYKVTDNFRWDAPYDVATDAAGNVYVLTAPWIFKLRSDGTVASYWSANETDARSIAADGAGNVFSVDWYQGLVRVFNAAGDESSSFGTKGTAPGQLTFPSSIDLAADGTAYVGDSHWISQFGGEPPPPPPAPCDRSGHLTGNVAVCADSIAAAGTGRWTATGNVRLAGGVSVGDGPITLDDGAKRISSSSSVTVRVMRPTPVSIGSGTLRVDAVDVTDDVSGRDKLAAFQTTGVASIVAGGLTFETGSQAALYLDSRDGGGVILSAKPGFDLLGALRELTTKGAFAVGVHASAGRKVRVLGGSVELGGFKIPGGWELGTLKVGYTEATDSWLFAGGGAVPWIKDKKLTIEGAIRGSRIDSLGVKLELGGTGIPLGTTGIILDTFGGSIQGLAAPPIIIKALVAGGWTKTGAPDPFKWILHIKDVTLTIDTSGGGGLAGGIAVVDGEGRLAKGTIDLSFAISPFRAAGRLGIALNAVPLGVDFATQAVLTREHVTATGTVTGKIVGIKIGEARGVLSEIGAGATVNILGSDIGYGLYWREAFTWPPTVRFIGADVDQFATVSARASQAGEFGFRVAPRRPLLVVESRGQAAATPFELVSPSGAVYRFGADRKDSWSKSYAGGTVRALAVYRPRAGAWRVRPAGTGAGARIRVQEVPSIGRVKPKPIRPRTTKKNRLPRSVRRVRLAWAPTKRMPAGTRVAIYTARKGGRPGKRLARGLRPRASVRIRVRRLSRGENRFTLVVSQGKTRFDSARFPNAVWKR